MHLIILLYHSYILEHSLIMVEHETPLPEICEVKAVTVHRETIKKDIIDIFQDPDVLKNILMFTIIGYNGSVEIGEGVGVAREALTRFWQQFCYSLAVGVQEKVPAIRHDHQKLQWEAIARVLVYGFICEKYFPFLCPWCLLHLVFFRRV